MKIREVNARTKKKSTQKKKFFFLATEALNCLEGFELKIIVHVFIAFFFYFEDGITFLF